MKVVARHCIVAVAILLLIAGCSHRAVSTAPAAPRTISGGARLSQAEAILIAAEAARKHGYRLLDYNDPQAHYEFIRKDKTWCVFYDGKVAMPGHHFLVVIDDQTGALRVVPGE